MDTPEPERRLIGYARVSTDDQDLTLQRQALLAYGVKPEHIFEEYASGGKMGRPRLQAALKSRRPEDTLVVWKLDRLGRTLIGVVEVAEMLAKEGVHLVSITEKLDTSSAMGKAFFHIALVFAQLERELIAERTKAGIAARKAQGIEFGAPHSISDNPKRIAAIRPYFENGQIPNGEISARAALGILNAADPGARPIRSKATWYRWLKLGAPGVDG